MKAIIEKDHTDPSYFHIKYAAGKTTAYAFTMLFVQMTPDVARAVNGMDITTVQWEDHGGFRQNFKVMAMLVPQIRADFNGNTGIVHATTS